MSKEAQSFTAFLIGAAICLSAVWGGCYAGHVIGPNDWRQFPIGFTAVAVFVFGLLIAVGAMAANFADSE